MSLENPVEPKENIKFIPKEFLAGIYQVLSKDGFKLVTERYLINKISLSEQKRIFLRDRHHIRWIH